MALRDRLHDEIDAQEELRETVTDVVNKIAAHTADIAQHTESLDEVFEALAAHVGNELAEVTTGAVRQGFDLAKKRAL